VSVLDGSAGAEQAQMALDAMYAAAGLHGAFDLLPIEAIEAMAGLTGDGSPLRDLLEKAWPEVVSVISDPLPVELKEITGEDGTPEPKTCEVGWASPVKLAMSLGRRFEDFLWYGYLPLVCGPYGGGAPEVYAKPYDGGVPVVIYTEPWEQ
jgi:hypothetical protein